MKVLAYILTAAAILIGADVFVMSPDPAGEPPATATEEPLMSLHGGNGIPPPPD